MDIGPLTADGNLAEAVDPLDQVRCPFQLAWLWDSLT